MFGRIVDLILLIVSLVGLATAGWWTVYGGQNSAEGLQNQLQQQADAGLQAGGHDWASVVMDGQHATVRGQAPSFEANEAVLLSLGEVSPFFTGITKITSEIAPAPPISPFVFKAERRADGAMRLDGHVPSFEILQSILAKAEDLSPGRVSHTVRIGSGAPAGPWLETALKGLGQMAVLDEGELSLVDTNLNLSGIALMRDSRAQILEALAPLAAPFVSNIDIAGISYWTARHEADGLVLAGQVPDVATRAALVALASAHYDGFVVNDMQIELRDYGDWLDTVRSALPQFAKFKSGRMLFSPDPSGSSGFFIKGLATGSVEAYLRQDLMTGDYPVSLVVETLEADLGALSGIDLSAPSKASCQAGFDAVMATNEILFETGSANIERASGATLDKIMAVANRCDGISLEIRAHTDTAGGREKNITLSEARAKAVKRYMQERGLVGARLRTAGLGPDDPIATNASEAGRAANRRIEFRLVKGD